MRNVFALAVIFVAGIIFSDKAIAQLRTPAPSPLCTIEQAVGLGSIKIVYSRPSAKGRKIIGDLVPYGRIWRTGANARTLITFNEEIKIESAKVPAGTYSLLTIPNPDKWTIILSKNIVEGADSHKTTDEVARVDVKPIKSEMLVETFTLMFHDITDESATLAIMWENLLVPIKLTVDTDAQVMKGIEATMAGPAANDYFGAASYYYSHEKDMKKALEWINKAIDLGGDRFWVVTMKARIQQKLGDYSSGIATAEKALKLAQEAKNSDYIKINQELIAAMKQ